MERRPGVNRDFSFLKQRSPATSRVETNSDYFGDTQKHSISLYLSQARGQQSNITSEKNFLFYIVKWKLQGAIVLAPELSPRNLATNENEVTKALKFRLPHWKWTVKDLLRNPVGYKITSVPKHTNFSCHQNIISSALILNSKKATWNNLILTNQLLFYYYWSIHFLREVTLKWPILI